MRAHQCIVLDMILKRCLLGVNTLKTVNQSHNQLLLFSGHLIVPSPHPHVCERVCVCERAQVEVGERDREVGREKSSLFFPWQIL